MNLRKTLYELQLKHEMNKSVLFVVYIMSNHYLRTLTHCGDLFRS